jgi:hypothetical protein
MRRALMLAAAIAALALAGAVSGLIAILQRARFGIDA